MKLLPEEFLGTGEVKGDVFHQKHRSEHAFMYERVHMETGVTYYEVFQRKINKETLFKTAEHTRVIPEQENYPKQPSFGVWAWCFSNYDKALNKFNTLTKYYAEEQLRKQRQSS